MRITVIPCVTIDPDLSTYILIENTIPYGHIPCRIRSDAFSCILVADASDPHDI